MSAPRPPVGLKASGRALWRAAMGEYEMAAHETAVLREACRTADSCDDLQALLDLEGIVSESSQGTRVHPALVELRQQRIALARLFAALQIPAEGDGRLAARPLRGVYGLRSAR